ncbi:MAG: cyclic nucleotide-binding domain-containing protein [Alphaproteobacteria bacterium]|nr:cyclic nucleotide-binding domain-containing protein [Alphaproteobacteria bacterium]
MKVRFLSHVSAPDIRRGAVFWNRSDLEPGEALWREGDEADELAILSSGELIATNRNVEVGRISAGELVGEASIFLGSDTRSATLTALEPSHVLVLSLRGLRRLRQASSPLYDALLAQALVTLVRRVRATDLRIARIALGERAAPARKEPGVLARMWRALRPGVPTTVCPPLRPLLRALPVLHAVPDEMLSTLEPHFQPQAIEEGEVIFLEGETGAAAYLIAEGHVDVLRHVRGERAERLATLRPGDLFGANTLVEKGARTASCVAAEPTWLYRVDAEGFHAPKGEAGRLWRESVVATLATQLRSANAVLNRVADPLDEAIAADDESSFQQLMAASGLLEALPSVEEADLEEIKVVEDETPRRLQGRNTLY